MTKAISRVYGIDKLIESSENLPSVAMSLVGANS